MKVKIKIGTRGSKLALLQADKVKKELEKKYPEYSFELKVIKTKGDKILDSPLFRIGEKGLFTKEIENSLLEEKIDLAVHSFKDLPINITPGLCIGAVLEREEVEDVLISKDSLTLEKLPSGAKIATSSLRRQAQLLYYRSDFRIINIRGNIDTRLKKLETEDLDGLLIAKSGILRLGFSKKITQTISTNIILPAVGQGALAVEIREGDEKMNKMVSLLDHPPTSTAILCERNFLKVLEGGCQVPIGAFARMENDKIILEGMVASLDGKTLYRDKITGNIQEAEKIGEILAKKLLERGGKEILENIRGKNKPEDCI